MEVLVTFCANGVSCFSTGGVCAHGRERTWRRFWHICLLCSPGIRYCLSRLINEPWGTTETEKRLLTIRSKLRRTFGRRGRQSKPPQVNCKATNLACSAWPPAHLCSCHSFSPAGYREQAGHWVTAKGGCGMWRKRDVRTAEGENVNPPEFAAAMCCCWARRAMKRM